MLNATDSTISRNTTWNGGGGGLLVTEGSSATLDRVTVDGNIAYHGRGIENLGFLSVSRSVISNNAFGSAGGGILNSGTLLLAATTLENNRELWGGGLMNSGQATVVNSTFSANNATIRGGGLASAGSAQAVVINSTFYANRAAGLSFDGGRGIDNAGDPPYSGPGTVILSNSVVAGNEAPYGPDRKGFIVLSGPNILGSQSECATYGPVPLVADPLLGPLADNGGPTKTHALLSGSQAVNAGEPASCSSAPVGGADQRGVARPQGVACDLGAFESADAGVGVGGKRLRISSSADAVNLAWDGGSTQTGYTLLRYSTGSGTADLLALPAVPNSYLDTNPSPGVITCYVLGATAPSGLLGLSDLDCALRGMAAGTSIPSGFTLTLNQTSNATLTWSPPFGGADGYAVARIPLDGSAVVITPLAGSATSAVEPAGPAGACFQLAAWRGSSVGYTNLLCGVPGVSTLSSPARSATSVADAAAAVQQALEPMQGRLAALAHENSTWLR